MVEEPSVEDPGVFRLELEKEMHWRMGAPKLEEDAESSERSVIQTGLAAASPVRVSKSFNVELTWIERWTAAGLAPVKLLVSWLHNFYVEDGQAVLISRSSV